MEIKKRSINNDKSTTEDDFVPQRKKVGNYECETTKTPNIFKIINYNGGFLVRCNYGRVEKISRKDGTKKIVSEVTLKVVDSIMDAKKLLNEVESIRMKRRDGDVISARPMIKEKISLDDVMKAFKEDKAYTELSKNYQMHYDNYIKHISDFMGYKEPKTITVNDIEEYYDYQLKRGNLDTARRNKDGSISKKEISVNNPEGISVNTIGKHKTALKRIWEFMLKKGTYGVESNIVVYSDIPKVEIEIDGKIIKTRKIQPKQTSLNLEQLNYTLNDAIQNEHDRSIVVMIALGAIGGLRRSEAVALKVGRYYHDERMKLGNDMWELNDFKNLKSYYIEHDELILIDEAITSNNVDVLGFPKDNIIRMVGKPKCLSDIVEYAMEQRMQVYDTFGVKVDSDERLYLPLINVIQRNVYTSQKLSRKWKEYQERRNKRMLHAGLEPIPIIRFHDLRHTHASLLSDEVVAKKISRNMGHVVPGEGQLYNTTTKVYIHDREPDRSDIIRFWDNSIKIDWDKALRVDINAPGNKAHVNGSGHFVISSEEKKKVMQLRKRFVLTEEEEAELLCSKNEQGN
ncbi:MAG: hypothetical protein IJN54_09160 [Lachnospiraceae bacterium]|nr:hypothetical protein [Lachnospiraceae bacterium]